MTIFEQWWQPIEQMISNKQPLTFFQTIYKELYMNAISDGRWKLYLDGLWVTLKVSFWAIVFGTLLGMILAVLRLPDVTEYRYRGSNPLKKAATALLRFFSWFAKFYIDVIRGTPLLLQVLIINFGIFGTIRIDKVIIGVIACGLNSAAYVAEIIRGGIMSVDRGQLEAGRSLGFNYVKTMQYIIVPQALKSVLPALANEFIVLLKETSVAGYVAVKDLTKGGDIIRGVTYSAFMPLIAVALIYLVLVMFFTWLVGKLERRLRNSEH
jgi:polar amino acid transport system permease protein/polar amino acid transport system substrate-binding protein